jgi:hypothetical protein
VLDCIGKQVFDACLENLAIRGRLVVVGFIAEYGKGVEDLMQPRIYHKLFWKAASVRGFLMPLYQEYAAEARDRLLKLLYTNKLKVAIDPTPFNGIESIPNAVQYLLDGHNCGKVVVRLGPKNNSDK